MYIQVLGSAAGGGFPQWNCNCVNCKGYRDGTLRAQARTQSSIALSDDGVHWVLCNASPDIRAQLQAFAPMQPARALRDTGINAIVLLDSQIDHTTGLLSLREGCPHQVWCTDMVHQDLEPHRARRQLRDRRLPQPALHPVPPAQRRAPLLTAPLRPAPGRQPWPAGRGHPYRRHTVLRPRPGPGGRQAAVDDARCRLPIGRWHALGG
ncbi:MAG: hypothetical protein DI560_07360 [Pseudomonas putida]|nr:MAG: hypothetical protein DI560_07360 [Pseudomonas putida]